MSKAIQHRVKGILWMTLAGCALSGHAAQTVASPPSATTHPSQEQAMTTAASYLTAEEIGHRVLKLIDTIHTVDDISPAHIEKIMGVKVEFNEKDPNDYGFGGKLTDEWSYNFGSLTDPNNAKPTRLELSFDSSNENNGDMTPVCKLNYEGYSKFLTDAGFKKSTSYAEHGRISSFNFIRKRVSVDINPGGDGKVFCVSILTIEVLPIDGSKP